MAAEFCVETSHFQAKAGRLSVNAMGPAHAEQAFMLEAEMFEHLKESVQILQNEFASLFEKQGIGCIHNI